MEGALKGLGKGAYAADPTLKSHLLDKTYMTCPRLQIYMSVGVNLR